MSELTHMYRVWQPPDVAPDPRNVIEGPSVSTAQEGQRARSPDRREIPILGWHQIALSVEQPALVAGFLPQGGLCCIYGESGCGKSFLVTDAALHVAQGWEWHGRRVKTAGVVYVAAEGAAGMMKRIVAFRQVRDVDIDSGTPFALVPTSLDLRGNEDLRPLIDTINRAAEGWDVPVGLVVIDTLSRVMAGGDENSPTDMGALVANLEKIRAETAACVCIIHHSGKDATRGARGHSLLRAALDTEISVIRDPATRIATATVTKQRDGEDGQAFSFQLESVTLADGPDGPITSCIVQPTEAPPEVLRRPKLTDAQQAAWDALIDAVSLHGAPSPGGDIPTAARVVSEAHWRDSCLRRGVTHKEANERQRWRTLRVALLNKGIVQQRGDLVWIPSQVVTKRNSYVTGTPDRGEQGA